MIPPGCLDERCFSGAIPFLEKFHIIIPVLDGNVIGEKSDLPERRIEVARIIKGFRERSADRIKVMHGVSYGATLALEILMTRKLKIERTVSDGGSFLKYGFLMRTMNLIGTKIYVAKIRKNPDKPTMYAELGEEIDRCGREVFSQMSGSSLKMLITDSMSGVKAVPGGVTAEDHLVVTYGEKDGYKGGLKWFDRSGYPNEQVIMKGYGHCRYFAEDPKEFIRRFYIVGSQNDMAYAVENGDMFD